MVSAAALTDAIAAAGCPVQGISIGDPGDRSTWTVQFGPGATDDQRQAAAKVIAGWSDPVTVTGNQWAFALKACKVASPWRAACARATDPDQIRLDLISRSTALELDDPLLVRVAALATPPIDVPTVMACAQGMPL